ncbi:MOSC domain-containing protein [Thioalkalivibrio sp. AKL12]|uniref:MOSC domain-containing protein n=1 Tax=Thioalkalivibrio sp. AKL12 TaxID=1158159 RepID=UPI00036436A3|nr:MOSC domain-containing protein [Thioalkalivibrio sp. AKL12]
MIHRLRAWRPEWFGLPVAHLQAIHVCAAAGDPMDSVESIEAIAGSGLRGDRYATHRGHWHAVESCPVTLITAPELQRASQRRGRPIAPGEHRRNLVVSDWYRIPRQSGFLRIGEAVLKIGRPRPPCGYLNQLVGDNLARALGLDSGICLEVAHSGILRVGDRVSWHPGGPA